MDTKLKTMFFVFLFTKKGERYCNKQCFCLSIYKKKERAIVINKKSIDFEIEIFVEKISVKKIRQITFVLYNSVLHLSF